MKSPPDVIVDVDTGEILPVPVRLGTLQASSPQELINAATAIATPLGKLIEDRKLYSNIQGKKYVRCEGWTTLAAMLGSTAHEVDVVEHPEGTFTATVELRRLSDGQSIARASAECGTDEPSWKVRARYARRSMALTRATAKAARLAFSWVMVLAGYEPTPQEEIPQDEDRGMPDAIPFGKDKGKKLTDCSVSHLKSIQKWCADKGSFPDLIEAIDVELEQRREQEESAVSQDPEAEGGDSDRPAGS